VLDLTDDEREALIGLLRRARSTKPDTRFRSAMTR
jgi:hypothetical protein